MWGEFIDQTNGVGNDEASVKWLLGEDHSTYRNMANPPAFYQPDKMTSNFYHHGDLENLDSTSFDNGGVHTNSGINNKAVYLMTDGGTFNGYTVTGLGLDKVAAIYYETQTNLLTSGANYKDLYYAVHQACVNIIGGLEGVTLSDCGEVQKALDAVEMNKDSLTNFMPQAQLCSVNNQPSNLFFDDFETNDSKWVLSDHSNGSSYWIRSTDYAASGLYSLYAPDYAGTSDTRAYFAEPVAIPATGTTYLYFKHSFGYEYAPNGDGYQTWDGGVLEYSIDNGAWTDASSILDSGQGYNGSVYTYSGGTNPLMGRSAFVSDSHGYVSSRYILNSASIKGHSINFRWRIGTDESNGDLGWSIDDVRIYTCQSDYPGTTLFSDDFSTAMNWTNDSSGTVSRDATKQLLNWSSTQATPLHYSIPIFASNDPVQLDFRYKVNSTSGNSLLWIGLTQKQDDLSPGVAAADMAGAYIGIDSLNKIQFLTLYPDLSYSQVDSAASTLAYGGNNVWRKATLTINQLNWSVVVKDDNGTEVGQMSGTLPKQFDYYNYLTLMYDKGGGADSITGSIDDIFVYGDARPTTFNDVPYSYTETLGGTTYYLHDYIQALYNAGLTVGTTTNPPNYSPTLTLDRSMSAVFILRANYGTSYIPPVAPWNTFLNESWSNNAYAQKWAEGMWKAHLTSGCQTNPLKYCPDRTLPRVEGIVFALHMKYDYFDDENNLVSYVPPPATGTVFADMTDTSYWGTKWAEAGYAEGILPACGTQDGKPLFCPLDPVNRAWAAYMIVKAKSLPLPP